MPSDIPEPLPYNEVCVRESGSGRFAQHVRMGRHLAVADEPTSMNGDDQGPSPYEYLLAGLGSCTSMTIRMYAELKKMPLTRVSVWLRHSKIDAASCAECETRSGQVDQIERVITLEGDLSDDQRNRLLEIARRCPVHRTLQSEVRVLSRLADADSP